jgi:predicted RND superfamily exporter protein
VTTLLAFVAFAYVSGTALQQFSWFGAAAIALAFLSVIVTVPVAAHWAARFGLLRAGHIRTPALGSAGKLVLALVTGRPLAIAVAALLAVAALTFVHFNIQPEYRITDYLPRTSEVRAAEMQANEVFGGRSALLVSVPKAEAGPVLSPANRQRLAETEAVIAELFPPERISSPLRLVHDLTSEAAIGRLAADLDAAGETQKTGFQSRDGSTMLITIRIPSSQSINETLDEIRALKASLGSLAFGDKVIVTGFDVLMAEEFTSLIEQLRGSLIIEVFLGILIIGIATRSPLLAIAAITPNLLPILFVEFVIWMRGGAVNMSEVIALTIGFGIAVGNAVHIINYFAQKRQEGLSVDDALSGAVIEAGPAVGASMLIICISTLVTQISVLPMVPVLGMLIISTLVVGFAANIAILPANILVLKRFFRENSTNERAADARNPEKTA